MELTFEQLQKLAHEFAFLKGQKVKHRNKHYTVHSIEIDREVKSLRFFVDEGLPHSFAFFMWLGELIEHNPEYLHLLPQNVS